MIAQRPYVIYKLPVSRTTQALTGGKIEKVWKNVTLFLTACTTTKVNEPRNIYLTAYTADEDHGETPELADVILENAKNIFGTGETQPVSYLYPANIPSKQTRTEWQLTAQDLEKAIKYLIDGQPYPKYNLGPIELIISYDFKLIDPISGVELPNQQYDSSFLIWLTKSSCVSVSLCFPFTEPNQEFWNYINSIKNFIPFKFDNKFLRVGRSNKKGTANMFSKL
ncbi:hypothetical protein [Mucilaginibacter sp. OK098]|uniref:hypothetical protein n=1 Tax=Mucilaginibacter sp. OK098 TaxID=1855297 RepID=UPI0009229B54|nr:hypothetical protein [Mucilaginibacter sp. OK098]SHM80612.1 hypothetical protein SAMN05216524_103475 [Mucilaginibacter sp. OK098]